MPLDFDFFLEVLLPLERLLFLGDLLLELLLFELLVLEDCFLVVFFFEALAGVFLVVFFLELLLSLGDFFLEVFFLVIFFLDVFSFKENVRVSPI